MRRIATCSLCLVLVAFTGCADLDAAYTVYCSERSCDGGVDHPGGPDGGRDGGMDGGEDGGHTEDAGEDRGVDGGEDAGLVVGSYFQLVAPANPVEAGQCGTLDLSERIEDGGVFSGSWTADLNSNSGSVSFYTATDCSGSTITQLSGSGTRQFSFKTTFAGSEGAYAFDHAGELSYGYATFQVNAAPPASLTPQLNSPVTVGDCLQLQLQVRDTFNNPAIGRGEQLLAGIASGTGASSFFAAPDCSGDGGSSLVQPLTGAYVEQVAWMATDLGNYNFEFGVDGGTVLSATGSLTADPLRLTVTAPFPQAIVNRCSTFTVYPVGVDSGGRAFNFSTTLGIQAPAGATVYDQCSGGTGISGLAVTPSMGSVSFAVQFGQTGSASVKVTSPIPQYLDGQSDFTVIVPPPTQVVFTNLPTSVATGSCDTTAIHVELRDDKDVPAPAPSDITVTVFSSDSRLQVASIGTCANSLTQVDLTIPAGDTTADFWLDPGSPVAGVNVEVVGPGLNGMTQQVTVN